MVLLKILRIVMWWVRAEVYLKAFVLDEFFQSINNKEIFVFIIMSNISCVEPAITVDCLSSRFWVVYVTCRGIQPHYMACRIWETGVERRTRIYVYRAL